MVNSALFYFKLNDENKKQFKFSRNCWLESSFVGNRPLDSPQTPVIDSTFSPRDGTSSQGVAMATTATRVNGVGESRLL